MAVSNTSTVLPRRTVIAGALAFMAAPVAAPHAETGDPAFAAKFEAASKAWADAEAGFANNKTLLRDIGECPAVPESLFSPLWPPGSLSARTAGGPGANGWSHEYLSKLVNAHWSGVYEDTRKKAAELLPIRAAYDAECDAWWSKVDALDDVKSAAYEKADALIRELIEHPVITLEEVKQKLAIVERSRFIECYDEGGKVREALLRDALAVAERLASHA